MAERKRTSQAQKAAAKAGGGKSTSKKKSEMTPEERKAELRELADDANKRTSWRFLAAGICLVLSIVLLVVLLSRQGILQAIIWSLVTGLIGKVGFYLAIPALLYAAVIFAFSGKRPVIMRTSCLGLFVLICGTIAHLAMSAGLPGGISMVGALYAGGAAGNTGGVVCGLVGIFFSWLMGNASYFVLVIAGILTLLASIQITIPSLIRAIQNRPKADWEIEEEETVQPEPAAIVVNHIAAKRIEYVERKRVRQEAQPQQNFNIDVPLEGEPQRPAAAPKAKPESRLTEMLRQTDSFDEPVAAASTPVLGEPDPEFDPVPEVKPAAKPASPRKSKVTPVPVKVTADLPEDISAPIPSDMPPFLRDEPVIADAPVLEKTVERAEPAVPAAPVEAAPSEKVTAKQAQESAALVAQEIAQNAAVQKPEYCFPPISLLNLPKGGAKDGTDEMRENSRRLNETLQSFKIDAHIINVTRGPSVTRYEVELDKGVRLNKLTNAADDIALNLGASGVRIAAVPGKVSIVGIEVPNRAVTTVSLREVIDSPEFSRAKSKSSFAVGKDIGGSCIVGNIAKLPHMLIAGTTGSGKSVCMNSIIISLLYKASPDDVKLIMVDPKMVELGIYNGIPHLLIPVVTDPKKAAGSLQWAVTEMMRRYKSMSDAGVRDLESYNSIVESQEGEGQKLPQVVVIIDELADLMLVAAKEVEESICRIAQMGRAAGIHLIIATQRPSADVITGLMKANIPSRIAFAVASSLESRIILDTQGAEKLVGKGDMLFAPIGCGKPKRVQGCYVDETEVEAVATYVKEHYITDYDQQVMDEIERKAAQTGKQAAAASDPEPTAEEIAGDEMLPAAVDVIMETGQASVSMLQRRLKLGYARAARIVDEMEERGIVGPFMGSKPRAILITKEQWQAMRSGDSTQMSFSDLPQDDFDDGAVPEEID